MCIRDSTYPAQLDYLSPNVDLNTGTLNIRARLDNPKGLLKSGLYVSIILPYEMCIRDRTWIMHREE